MAKTSALKFPNEDALLVALRSGMIPSDVQAQPVTWWRDAEGALGVAPSAALPKDVLVELANAGIDTATPPKDAAQAMCWAAMVTPQKRPESDIHTDHVLFVMTGERPLLDLSGELLRLGCDRQSYTFTSNGKGVIGLLRASDPPFFTVASALDATSGFRAFVPARPAQETVWTELGCAHPMRETIHPGEGEVLLISKEGKWLTFENGPWSDIYQLIDFRLPGDLHGLTSIEAPRRLEVPLKLARASRTESSSLWVVRENAVDHMDRLVQTLPDDIIARLLFAVTGTAKQPIVVLRAKLGRQGPPQIDIPGEGYVPLLQIANLYVPRDAIIEPPLRRDKLRELLAPSSDDIAWLAPSGEEHDFQLEAIADAAFAPLSDWVDYLISSEAAALEPWVRASTFDFEPFQSVGAEWAAGPPAAQRERPKRKDLRQPRSKPTYQPRVSVRRREEAEPVERLEVDPLVGGATEEHVATADETALADLEREFLEMDAPADDPERRDMWVDMAVLNQRVSRLRETGLCWTRALWDSNEDAVDVAGLWADAEGVGIGADRPESMIRDYLQLGEPSRDEVRSVVSYLVHTEMLGGDILQRIGQGADNVSMADLQEWLDRHDDVLDVRSIWLARIALARQTGGDRLAAARTRDRILARLATGLSLEKDVPRFLRFLGGGATAGGEGGTSDRLVEHVEELMKTFSNASRNRHATEAPEELTRAYVTLVFAYGFARLGRSERARELRTAGLAALDASDDVHGFLSRAYGARIDQALEGRPVETPLPGDIAGELNNLEKFHRYKVDRLREVSPILEAQERLNPTQAYVDKTNDLRGEEFVAMRGMTDTEQLAGEVQRLLDAAIAAAPEERDRLFDGVMDFFPLLPSHAVPHLQMILGHLTDIQPVRRGLLLQEAQMLAGYFGRSELVRDITTRLQELVGQLSSDEAVQIASQLAGSLRSLRRVGLKAEAADLLDTIHNAVTGDSDDALIARVNLAAGLAYLSETKRAEPTLRDAHTKLTHDPLRMQNRLRITQAVAQAWSQFPQSDAVRGLNMLVDQLPNITDSFNTNSHFCLSVVQFMEAIVLGYASEDLALGELGRRWLDEDEYMIRRRIHRDLGELT